MKYYNFILLTTVSLILYTCEKPENGSKPTIYNISGYVQKGPFITGSSILIQELDDELNPTGITYHTATNDDFGSFAIESELNSEYVEIVATGFYYNEIKLELSSAMITLKSISDLSSSSNVNINILTTLEYDRIKYLVKNENMAFSAAKEKAESEILSIFNISIDDILSFDQMDISEDGESNAILLAVSSILQGDNTEAEFSEIISKIAKDIVTDGKLETTKYIDEIHTNSVRINLSAIKKGLISRFNDLGHSLTISNFQDYVDSDGDGVLNKDDEDPIFFWNLMTESAEWSPRSGHVSIVYDNKIWIIGGVDNNGHRLNDVWYSENGVEWNQATSIADWTPRSGHCGIVFNNKMWIIGGVNNSGIPINDVWYSENGVEWNKATSIDDYSNCIESTIEIYNNMMWLFGEEVRHTVDGINWINEPSANFSRMQHSSIIFKDKIWIMGGIPQYYNDVLYSEDGINWIEAISSANWSGRSCHTSEVFDDKMWILGGGYGGELSQDRIWHSEDGINWTELESFTIWSVRYRHASVVFDNKIWIFGGSDDDLGRKNDVWCYGIFN